MERDRRLQSVDGRGVGRVQEGDGPSPLWWVLGSSPKNIFQFKMSVDDILMHFEAIFLVKPSLFYKC